jgi:hypothetical protein
MTADNPPSVELPYLEPEVEEVAWSWCPVPGCDWHRVTSWGETDMDRVRQLHREHWAESHRVELDEVRQVADPGAAPG